jgi:hypothetical protein
MAQPETMARGLDKSTWVHVTPGSVSVKDRVFAAAIHPSTNQHGLFVSFIGVWGVAMCNRLLQLFLCRLCHMTITSVPFKRHAWAVEIAGINAGMYLLQK